MQGYQVRIPTSAVGYLDKLITPRAEFSTSDYECTKRAVDGGRPGVPDSPGHARRLHPYPPGRRRR
jgi:hypothetical protein